MSVSDQARAGFEAMKRREVMMKSRGSGPASVARPSSDPFAGFGSSEEILAAHVADPEKYPLSVMDQIAFNLDALVNRVLGLAEAHTKLKAKSVVGIEIADGELVATFGDGRTQNLGRLGVSSAAVAKTATPIRNAAGEITSFEIEIGQR